MKCIRKWRAWAYLNDKRAREAARLEFGPWVHIATGIFKYKVDVARRDKDS